MVGRVVDGLLVHLHHGNKYGGAFGEFFEQRHEERLCTLLQTEMENEDIIHNPN
jgi:hypothetical protein